MTTVLTLHSANQSASRRRISSKKVPKTAEPGRMPVRAHRRPYAIVATISMAAAFGLTTAARVCWLRFCLALHFESSCLQKRRARCAVDHFLNGSPKTSPLSRSATTHGPCFFYGVTSPKKWTAAPFPARIARDSFYPHRRPRSATVF